MRNYKLTVKGKWAMEIMIGWIILTLLGLCIPKDKVINIQTNPNSIHMVQDTIARDDNNFIGER